MKHALIVTLLGFASMSWSSFHIEQEQTGSTNLSVEAPKPAKKEHIEQIGNQTVKIEMTEIKGNKIQKNGIKKQVYFKTTEGDYKPCDSEVCTGVEEGKTLADFDAILTKMQDGLLAKLAQNEKEVAEQKKKDEEKAKQDKIAKEQADKEAKECKLPNEMSVLECFSKRLDANKDDRAAKKGLLSAFRKVMKSPDADKEEAIELVDSKIETYSDDKKTAGFAKELARERFTLSAKMDALETDAKFNEVVSSHLELALTDTTNSKYHLNNAKLAYHYSIMPEFNYVRQSTIERARELLGDSFSISAVQGSSAVFRAFQESMEARLAGKSTVSSLDPRLANVANTNVDTNYLRYRILGGRMRNPGELVYEQMGALNEAVRVPTFNINEYEDLNSNRVNQFTTTTSSPSSVNRGVRGAPAAGSIRGS